MASWAPTGERAERRVAGYPAIAAISLALVTVLEEAAGAPGGEFADLPVALVQGGRLAEGLPTGLSVYLRHVAAGRTASPLPPPEEHRPAAIAVDLHYLVTAWADSAELQHRLLGWCLRTLHASPVLPAAALHQSGPDVFDPTEVVMVDLEPLSPAELREMWPVAAAPTPSLAYCVRSLQIR